MKSLLSLLFIFCTLSVYSQSGYISKKTGIRKGELSNGITYYLCKNSLYNHPMMQGKGKVNFYIIQNVGAILEKDSQNGLAHFLEHMAFNGTMNYPGNKIKAMFEKRSLSHCINAYTTLDETIYHLTNIPSKDKAFCDNCLLILHDWANYLTLDSLAIEKERPVILEEMRLRNTVNSRIREEMIPYTHNFSKYAYRNIIGPAENIANFKKEELYDFYHTWYRTDLQAIVVIGDINLDETENKIKRIFSGIEQVKNPQERYYVDIPDNDTILYAQIKNKHINNGIVDISVRFPKQENISVLFRDVLINKMLKNRVKLMLEDDSTNFLSADISIKKIAEKYCSYGINIGFKEGKLRESLEKVFELHNDILQNGFKEEELKRAVRDFSERLKNNRRYYNMMSNDVIFEMIKSNFISKSNILHPSETLSRFEEFIKATTISDINKWVDKIYNSKNKSIVLVGNTNDTLLTKNEIIALEKATLPSQSLCKKKQTNFSNTPIINEELKEVSVKDKEVMKIFGAKKWVLSNGATVIYKQCEKERNKIDIYAHSYGGSSNYNGNKYVNAHFFNVFNNTFGIKGIDCNDFKKILKDRDIKYKLKLKDDSEELYINGEYKHVESMFELLYGAFEHPTFYQQGLNKDITNLIYELRDIPITYKIALNDSLEILKYGKERYIRTSECIFSKISLPIVKNIYKERYFDASNWTFYIVGGIGEKRAKKLSQKYIGNITSSDNTDTFKEFRESFSKEDKNTILKFDMEVPKAGVYYFINTKQDFSFEKQYIYKVLRIFLRDKIQKVIRQMQRGTYNVDVKHYYLTNTYKDCGYLVNFECAPERVYELDKLLQITFQVIKKNGISKSDYNIIMKMLNPPKNYERSNIDYIAKIKDYMEYGEDKSDVNYFINQHKEVTYQRINKELTEFLNKAVILNAVYMPKEENKISNIK